MAITASALRSLLRYDEEKGEFFWLVSQGTRTAGSRAGNHRPDGYVYIKINRVMYRRTRLIWLYKFGHWPMHHVDHINRNTSDDRIVNLRDATRSQNLANRKTNKNNKTGFKGVSPFKDKFGANINKDGTRYYLGLFDTAEQAHVAYCNKAREMFGEFARFA